MRDIKETLIELQELNYGLAGGGHESSVLNYYKYSNAHLCRRMCVVKWV